MSDQREELARLIYERANGTSWTALDTGSYVLSLHMAEAYGVADAVLASGYVKLADLASDPAMIEAVAKEICRRQGREWPPPDGLPDEPLKVVVWRYQAEQFLDVVAVAVAAALAATPGDSNE